MKMDARLESFYSESIVAERENSGKRVSLESCCELFNPNQLFHGGAVILAYSHEAMVYKCAAESIGCRKGIFWNIKLLELVFNMADAFVGVYAVAKMEGDEVYIYALKSRLTSQGELETGLKKLENRLRDVLGIERFRLVVSDSGNEEEAIDALFRQNSHLKPMNEWVTQKALKLLSLLI